MVYQSCISNDKKEYAHGSLNASGTHRCRDGVWDKVGGAAPGVGTTETGLKEPPTVDITVKEVINIVEKIKPKPRSTKK
mgnify:CR=1 FL=1